MVTNEKGEVVNAGMAWIPVFRRDYARSGMLARQAIAHTQNVAVQAEAYFLLARAEHAEGPAKYIDAWEHVSPPSPSSPFTHCPLCCPSPSLPLQYGKSSKLAPDFPLPWLGLAQISLHRERSGRSDAALAYVGKLLDKYPNNIDALRLKAAILAKKVCALWGHVLLLPSHTPPLWYRVRTAPLKKQPWSC